MKRRRTRLSRGEARRVALAAQGLDRAAPGERTDVRHLRRALRAIGALQLDFVNVLLPAHFLVLWSRLGAYDRGRVERWLYETGEFTEQWAHEASIVPVADWPLLGYRRRSYRQFHRSPLYRIDDREGYLEGVLEQVRRDGALTSADLPAVEGPAKRPGDWHRSVPRWALEHHFGSGQLAVRRRLANFQRVYDLSERVLPGEVLGHEVDEADGHRGLIERAAASLGVATLSDLADYYRLSPREAAPRVAELVEDGRLLPVLVEGWSAPAFMDAGARVPRSIDGAGLLSPFDPVTWCRPRAERLFGFEYRIEIYVPAPKRRWGYYVLPFRLGEGIAARVDLKADRPGKRLLVQRAHLEPGAKAAETSLALRTELSSLAAWLELESVAPVARDRFTRSLATRVV